MADEVKKDAIDEGKSIAWLSYLGLLFLIPLLVKPDNEYCKFHVKQGIALFIYWIVLQIVWVIPVLGWVLGTIGWVVLLIISILGIIKSLQGEYWKAPLGIAQLAEKFKF